MLRTSATTEAQSLTAFHGYLNKRLENSYKNDKYFHSNFGNSLMFTALAPIKDALE